MDYILPHVHQNVIGTYCAITNQPTFQASYTYLTESTTFNDWIQYLERVHLMTLKNDMKFHVQLYFYWHISLLVNVVFVFNKVIFGSCAIHSRKMQLNPNYFQFKYVYGPSTIFNIPCQSKGPKNNIKLHIPPPL